MRLPGGDAVSLLAAWSDIPIGTLVSLRRAALSGEKAEFTRAWTASGPYVGDDGVALIRVDVSGVVVPFPLGRVSLGWTEPRVPALPVVPLATVLDPVPVRPEPRSAGGLLVTLICAVLVALGTVQAIEWVLGP